MDELALINVPITKVDIVTHILNGIKSKFKVRSTIIRVCKSLIDFEELYEKFIDYEEFQKKEDNHSKTLVVNTNYTHHSIRANQGNSKNLSNGNFSNKSQYTHN